MNDHSITPGEFLVLLALFSSPVYLLAGAIQWLWLGRRHVRHRFVAVGSSIGLALPLTAVLWWASGQLPRSITDPIWGGLGVFALIGLPALVASLIVFPTVARIARRRTGAPAI